MKSLLSDCSHIILGSLCLGIVNCVEGSALEGILGSLRRSVASGFLNSLFLHSKHLSNNKRRQKTHHGLDEVLHFGRHVWKKKLEEEQAMERSKQGIDRMVMGREKRERRESC